MGVETITVFLLKESVAAASDALRPNPGFAYSEHALNSGRTRGTLFVAQIDEKEPDWARLLRPVTQPALNVRTRTSSALLVLKASERWFAITFGQGRHLLNQEVYVRRFGLRVALNAADPARLRGAQARSFNDNALHTQRQVSRLSNVEALELDVERDLITNMAGALADDTIGKRIEGRDSVRLTAEISTSALAGKCSKLLQQSKRLAYKKHYPWIDNIEEITDPGAVASLEAEAAATLGAQRFGEFDLFPPELIAEEIVEFRTHPKEGGLVVIEPEASLLRYAIPSATNAQGAADAVQRYKLVGLDGNGEEAGRWSFWECLHHEMKSGSDTIVLDDGHWYRVGKSLAAAVEQFTRTLGPSGLQFPKALRGETEGGYNARTAQATGMALLDSQLIHLAGQTSIEPCDLISNKGHFVHVKRRKGGSGPLSHLFGQALVSSECLVREPEFRHMLREKLSTLDPTIEALITEPVQAGKLPVVLGLITKPSPTGHPARELPFFAKVFLRQTVRRLQTMSFTVFVDEIAIDTLAPATTTQPRH